ncbi:synaptotagmin-7-like isoform X2 [Montipora capricornis]|uniref:synaptotagmin-7-like isoform X2 n=1 Tax=Montipora foliosa TaxID=591990 RepID=UPI0035F17D9C
MVNQVFLAVGLGLVTGIFVVAVYFIIQYIRHRSSKDNRKYSQLSSDPKFRSRAIVKQDIPLFCIPRHVPFELQQPIGALERTESLKKEQYCNGSTHMSPTVHRFDVRKKADDSGGVTHDAINPSPLPSPPPVSNTPQTSPRKVPSISGLIPLPSPSSQQRKVAVHQKKPRSKLGKLEFSLYYDQSFRYLEIFVARGIKIASPEAGILPVVLVIGTITFEGTQIWEQKTRPASRSSDPVFNEKLAMNNIISGKLQASVLHFQLYDEQTKYLIGEVNYRLKELPPNKLSNQILPLESAVNLEESGDSGEESSVDSCFALGELLISLCYNPTDQKLNVKIISARGLQPIANGRVNPFVKLDVTFCGRKLSSRSTKTAHHTLAPNFCELFVIDMQPDKLAQVTLIFKVKHSGRVRDVCIGTVHLGYCVHVEGEYRHWEQSMEKPHMEIEYWHPIQEQFVD